MGEETLSRSRALMEAVLRPFDLATTQWYVLHLLATHGSRNQRELTHTLEIERVTLNAVVGALVRKGLVEQLPDPGDPRHKIFHLTAAGRDLLGTVPDPIALMTAVAFDGVEDADVATTQRVLRAATEPLITHQEGSDPSMTILVTGGTGLVRPRILP